MASAHLCCGGAGGKMAGEPRTNLICSHTPGNPLTGGNISLAHVIMIHQDWFRLCIHTVDGLQTWAKISYTPTGFAFDYPMVWDPNILNISLHSLVHVVARILSSGWMNSLVLRCHQMFIQNCTPFWSAVHFCWTVYHLNG